MHHSPHGASGGRLVREIADHIEALPLLPMVVARLMTLSEEDDDYFEKVLTLAEEDPTFAVRLIRMANSVAFQPAQPIVDIRSAVARIGAHHIASMLTSLAVLEIFVPTRNEIRNLWLHSVQTAIAARELHRFHPASHTTRDQVYLCGLLHDIGRFVLFDAAVEEIRALNEREWCSEEELLQQEQELFHVTHAELGWHLCHRWRIPEKVGIVVREHHNAAPDGAPGEDREIQELIRLIQAADRISFMLLCGQGSRPETDVLAPVRECLELSEEQLQAVCRETEEEARRVAGALGLRVD